MRARYLLVAVWIGAVACAARAHAACEGVELDTHDRAAAGRVELIESSCHESQEHALPWMDSSRGSARI